MKDLLLVAALVLPGAHHTWAAEETRLPLDPAQANAIVFAAAEAKFVRLTVSHSSSGNEPDLDEVELYQVEVSGDGQTWRQVACVQAPEPPSKMPPPSDPVPDLAAAVKWLKGEAHRVIRASAVPMNDGTLAFPPQIGIGYDAFWLRDYEYTLEGSNESYSNDELTAACRLFVKAIRADGAAVDCIRFDGTPIYKPGYGTMGREPVLDGPPFTVSVAWHTYQRTKDPALLREILDPLIRTMDWMPRNPANGLAHIKEVGERCSYGFTDSIAKSGDDLFCSLLLVQAARQLGDLLQAAGRTEDAHKWQQEAERVADSVRRVFWDEQFGLFRSTTGRGNVPDIWGSAFAVWLGVAAEEQAPKIADYFKEHHAELTLHGQVRHIPGFMDWSGNKTPRNSGSYQSGAFWATPVGWFVYTLDLADPALADQTVIELVRHCQQYGTCEWINHEGRRVLPGYLASAALPLDGIRAMLSRRAQSTAGAPQELLLSGEDWRIVSFEPGAGVQHRAFEDVYSTRDAIPATVPGDVHWDLERADRIPPIYYGLNSQKIGWVAGKEWWYRKTFVTPAGWRGKTVRLCFDGVDYLTDVWLNGCLLGSHEGQFTPFEFDVTGLLRVAGENVLTVLIHPAPAAVRNAIDAGAGEWPVMEIMRPAYPYWKCMTNAGWDWGAKIITMGIWKDVRLIASEGVCLAEPIVLPQLAPPYDQATLHVRLPLQSDQQRDTKLDYRVRCLTAEEEPVVASRKASLSPGNQQLTFSMEVPHPRLWWPNGYGQQHLYELEVSVLTADGTKTLDRAAATFGIRDLKMLQNPEVPDNVQYVDYDTGPAVTHQLPQPPPERKYLIQINGRRIFARGGNWIPCDLLYGRPRQPFYEHLIRLAAQAHYNLFRVWGGGLIDKPEFFELCDRYGIMLFQEFPNGGVRLPETDAALAITGNEVRQILPLLMNHPSIVRYGGGNEWYRNAENSRQMAQLRTICNEMDPTRPYHDPDPECIAQRHGPHSYEWNQHYRTYNTGYPLTAGPDNPLEWTEYGASGAASVETLERIMPAEHLWPIRSSDPYWTWHKAFGAYGADNWMGSAQYLHLFGDLPDLETTVRCSQFVQAEGLRYANQSMRRHEWHRSACASWTYNEPWPNAAHGCVVEYHGKPKMAYYYSRASYAPVDVSAEYPSLTCQAGVPFPLKLFAVSDHTNLLQRCQLTATAVDVRGREFAREIWRFDLAPETSCQVATFNLKPLEESAGSVVLVQLRLADSEGKELSVETYTFGVIGQTLADALAPLRVPAVSSEGRRNLALLPDAKAAASSCLPGYAMHQIAHLHDGWYGNEASWIEGADPAWAQIDLGTVYTISRVCVGNDHTLKYKENRGIRQARILAATEYSEDSSALVWHTVATYQGVPLEGTKAFDFDPVKARFVRVDIGDSPGARIDEIEVYETDPLAAGKIADAKAAAVRGQEPAVPDEAQSRGCLNPLLTAPATELELSIHPGSKSDSIHSSAAVHRATVRNCGKVPALFVTLDTDATTAMSWHATENYFTLLAGETREVEVLLLGEGIAASQRGPTTLRAKAWNSPEVSRSVGMSSAPRGTSADVPRQWQARWIWTKVAAEKPFQFVRFRKSFELNAAVQKATAFVTADTFYRLWVNGELAMQGPARSSAGKATVDPVEVMSLLRLGRNSIEAEAFHYDGRFEALGQAPGFLCELEIAAGDGQQLIPTDASWEACEITAWSRQAPKFSFQRTWVEDFDARLELAPAWRPAVVLGEVGMAPWKTDVLRDVPLPDPQRIIRPARVLGVQRGDGFTGEMETTRYGPRPDWCRRLQTEQVRPDASAATNPGGVTSDGRGNAVLKGDGASIAYDLSANNVGFIGFEVSGVSGQTLELAWNESLDDSGQTVRPIQGIDANQALRYTLRDGRQSFLTFNPYLLRFVRIVQRGGGEITLHRLWMVDHSFAAPAEGAFECSDEGLNHIYEAARRTARLNTLDTFMDNPSRERGAWMREGYWTARTVYACFGDLSVSRRMVRQGADPC